MHAKKHWRTCTHAAACATTSHPCQTALPLPIAKGASSRRTKAIKLPYTFAADLRGKIHPSGIAARVSSSCEAAISTRRGKGGPNMGERATSAGPLPPGFYSLKLKERRRAVRRHFSARAACCRCRLQPAPAPAAPTVSAQTRPPQFPPTSRRSAPQPSPAALRATPGQGRGRSPPNPSRHQRGAPRR